MLDVFNLIGVKGFIVVDCVEMCEVGVVVWDVVVDLFLFWFVFGFGKDILDGLIELGLMFVEMGDEL